LLGCWEEKTIDPGDGGWTTSPGARGPAQPAEVVEVEALPRAKEVLALPPSPLEAAARRRNRRVLIASAVISLVVSLLTVFLLTRWMIKRDLAAANTSAAERNAQGAGASASERAGVSARTVKVVVRVERGRVSEAFVEEHRPGMEAYEALALRIARGRRYSLASSGQETVAVNINSPE
jgi:hypothetical protein